MVLFLDIIFMMLPAYSSRIFEKLLAVKLRTSVLNVPVENQKWMLAFFRTNGAWYS